MVYEQNRNTGRLLVDQYMLTLHWGMMDKLEDNRQAFVSPTPDEERTRQEQTDRWVDEMTHRLTQQRFTPELIRPNRTDGPGAPQDDFERKACEKFLANPSPSDEQTASDAAHEHAERFLADPEHGQLYQYYEPIRARRRALPSATRHRWAARGSTPRARESRSLVPRRRPSRGRCKRAT